MQRRNLTTEPTAAKARVNEHNQNFTPMSTRSLTTVRSRWNGEGEFETHANIYRHHDGYLEGHGQWLFDFLNGLVVVNGIGAASEMPARYVNGPGRLAAALVAKLHEDGHEPNLNATSGPCGQEFHYQIDVEFGMSFGRKAGFPVRVTVFDGPMTAFGSGCENCTNKIFDGTVDEYGAFLAARTADA